MSGRVLCALLMLAVLQPPSQPQVTLRVSEPETEAFPTISLLVTVSDEDGRRVEGLTVDDFQLIEDQQPIADYSLEPVTLGTRQVFVINTAPGLGVRDSRGRTRFDFARDQLTQFWLNEQAGLVGLDDLSLLTADGLLIQHSGSAAELSAALDQLSPSFEGGISGFDLLLLALDFASDPVEPSTVPSSMVFVTPVIETPRDLPLANAISRARDTSTAVYPVLFSNSEVLDEPLIGPLRELAAATGGEFVVSSTETGIEDLADRLLEQRHQYRLSYRSQASSAGPHTLQLVGEIGGAEQASTPITYQIEVAPPQVAFIQPPNLVTRATDDPELAPQDIPPTTTELELLLTFPDGHPRQIVHSELVVDGDPVIVRDQPPFERFSWDLSRYPESGSHTISASVIDELGLEANTVAVSVQVDLVRPPQGLSAIRPVMDNLLAGVAILVAGMVMVLGVTSLARRTTARQAESSPRLNPVKRARLRSTTQTEAHLVPVRPVGDPIALSGVDVVLGRDASLSAVVLDDPSVERMHARLIRQADGDYLLRDQGSVAGTWVNYELVGSNGRRLRHGDLVQLGRVELRFQLPGEQPARPVRVYPDGEQEQA